MDALRHVTRIDSVLDDRAATSQSRRSGEAVSGGQCVTCAAQVEHIVSNLPHGTGAITGETLYFESQTLLHIYDKRLELQSKEQETWKEYGIRRGLEFRRSRPNSVPAYWPRGMNPTGRSW